MYSGIHSPTSRAYRVGKPAYFNAVFGRMFGGLLVTAITTAVFLAVFQPKPSLGTIILMLGAFVVELVLVWKICGDVFQRNRPRSALLKFYVYAALNGVSLAPFIALFAGHAVVTAFVVSACMFGVAALFGAVTRIDLTRFGGLVLTALCGLLAASVVGAFLGSKTFDLVITVAGVVLFLGITAYDIQHLEELYEEGWTRPDGLATYGALSLYLDLVNIFIRVLELMGDLNKTVPTDTATGVTDGASNLAATGDASKTLAMVDNGGRMPTSTDPATNLADATDKAADAGDGAAPDAGGLLDGIGEALGTAASTVGDALGAVGEVAGEVVKGAGELVGSAGDLFD